MHNYDLSKPQLGAEGPYFVIVSHTNLQRKIQFCFGSSEMFRPLTFSSGMYGRTQRNSWKFTLVPGQPQHRDTSYWRNLKQRMSSKTKKLLTMLCRKFREQLLTYFYLTTYRVCDTTSTVQKIKRSAVIYFRLQRGHV